MQDSFLSQLGASLYQLTSLQYGNFNLADFALQVQSYILNSLLVHMLEFISAAVTIFLLIMAIRLAAKQKEFSKKLAEEAAGTELMATPQGIIESQWHDILRHIESTQEGEWKFAVIEADTMTDNVLKNYFPGDTMGERLMNIDKTQLLSIDTLWEAHKIRNRLAHDPNYFLRHAEAYRAVRLYETTLKELGVIQ